MARSVAWLAIVVALPTTATCDSRAKDDWHGLRFMCGSAITFTDPDRTIELRETSRGPDGATFEVVRGAIRYLYVMQGASMGFPVVPGGVVREHPENPVGENILDGRLKELRFRQGLDCTSASSIQVVIVPESGPDRDKAEAIARSIRVE